MSTEYSMKVRQTLFYTYSIEANCQNEAFKKLSEAIDDGDNDLGLLLAGHLANGTVSDQGILNYVCEAGKPSVIMPGLEGDGRIAFTKLKRIEMPAENGIEKLMYL